MGRTAGGTDRKASSRVFAPAEVHRSVKRVVEEKLGAFFAGLTTRTAEVQSRCRTKLQALAEEVAPAPPDQVLEAHHVDPTCALV